MKILHIGQVPKYKIECPHCKTVFVATEKEAVKLLFGVVWLFECPICEKISPYTAEMRSEE